MKDGIVVAYDRIGGVPVRWYKNSVLLYEQLRLW